MPMPCTRSLGSPAPQRFRFISERVVVFFWAPFQLPFSPRDRSDKSELLMVPRRFALASAVTPFTTCLLYRLCVPRSLLGVPTTTARSIHRGVSWCRLRGFPTDTVSANFPSYRWATSCSASPYVAVSHNSVDAHCLSRSFGAVQRRWQFSAC